MYMSSSSSKEGLETSGGGSAGAVGHGEHGAEAGLAAVHPLEGVLDAVERISLDAGTDAALSGKDQRVLGILGGPARPSLDGSARPDQGEGGDGQRLEHGGDEEQLTTGLDPVDDGGDGSGARCGREDDAGAAERLQRLGGLG